MKSILKAAVIALAIVWSAWLIGDSYVERGNPDGTIQVTGLGEKDFSSNLIVWAGYYNAENVDLAKAYEELQRQKDLIKAYLIEKGVNQEQIVFNAVQTRKNMKKQYTPNGDYMGEKFEGYQLTQSLKIESKEVEKIEKISREITELLNQGVQFYSQSPLYYYTQLADLKIEMISKATEDARLRAEKIAENSGATLGDLNSARMGVFQITGQNSNENYSWGGTFNTRSKEKTASITMKLEFEID